MNIPNNKSIRHLTRQETAKTASQLECAYDLCRIILDMIKDGLDG
jgi:hypothetical protein